MNIQTIIFDLDGPILEGKKRHYQCYATILKKYQQIPLDCERYWQLKRDRCNLIDQLKLSNSTFLYDTFKIEWFENIEDKEYLLLDQLQPDVYPILLKLKEQNIRLILTTMRQNQENLFWQLKQLKIIDLFDKIVVANCNQEINKIKGVKTVIKYESPDFFWIGDTEVDVQSAQSLEIKVGLVTNGLRNQDFLNRLNPDFMGENVTEILSSIDLVER